MKGERRKTMNSSVAKMKCAVLVSLFLLQPSCLIDQKHCWDCHPFWIALLDPTDRPTQCTIELRSETGLLSSPWQIPLALSSIFAPIDRQEPLMNWMTTTVVGKNILTEIWWALRLFVPTVVHHNFWGGGFAFCVLWCSCGLAAATKPLWSFPPGNTNVALILLLRKILLCICEKHSLKKGGTKTRKTSVR